MIDAQRTALATERASAQLAALRLNTGVPPHQSPRRRLVGHLALNLPVRSNSNSDIAAVAVFLAFDDSGWLTGELIRAGGGMH